jgi:hypothetical protein
MELFSEDISKVKTLLESWKTTPEIEVEATFGLKGKVDLQTFLRVISRLKSKGYEAISQQDRLTISIPLESSVLQDPTRPKSTDSLRFTLVGSGHVSQYCRDNIIQNKPYTVIIKNQNISLEQKKVSTIDIKEYNTRIKGRREEELSENDPRVQKVISADRWPKLRKYFRLIRRWTFKIPGLKFDLSMVRNTQEDRYGRNFQTKFQDQPLMSYAPSFEIEVELDRETIGEKDPFTTLIAGVGDILRGIQNNSLLIRNSVKEKALDVYKDIAKTDRFRGVQPVTLELHNMKKEDGEEANIRENYNVTDKADGLRVMAFTNSEGELFMIDMAMNIYRTGYKKAECKLSLLDGEYITRNKKGEATQALLFFDMYNDVGGVDVSKKPFLVADQGDCRFNDMMQWMAAWNEGSGPNKLVKSTTISIGVKKFFASNEDNSIFDQANNVLNLADIRDYNTDGLIFTPNNLPLPPNPGSRFQNQFKWKPPKDNTVDFLVSTVKDEKDPKQDKIFTGIHPKTQDTIRYKILQLFVGSAEDPALRDARATILYDKPLPDDIIDPKKSRAKYRAVPFVPRNYFDAYSSVCYLQTKVDPKTNEEYITTTKYNSDEPVSGEFIEQPIRDLSIVEMGFDPTQPPGWRWIPIRVRQDKTERLTKGVEVDQKADQKKQMLRLKLDRTLNSQDTADGVWNSIHNPVTESMIRTGSEVPSDAEKAEMNYIAPSEVKKYYERKPIESDQRLVKELHEFHNKYIKKIVLYGSIGAYKPKPKILDTAVGRANDLHRWRELDASFVFGVDVTGECCKNAHDNAYLRLVQTKINAKKQQKPLPIPTMFFVIGDSSLRFIDGASGENDEEADMMRAIFGKVAPTGIVPPAIQKNQAILRDGADVITCMYALHYFFESSEKLDGLLQNIADNLKIGGLFVGTNFDGDMVFNLLRRTPKGKSKSGIYKGRNIWEITKQYDQDQLPQDDSAFGMAVDVNFISIGLTHREYLIPWKLFVEKMKTVGCELLGPEDLKKIGLENSSNIYENSYDMAMKTPRKKEYEMNEVAKEFSFLNRWYIFKRTSEGQAQIGKLSDEYTKYGVASEPIAPAVELENSLPPLEKNTEESKDSEEVQLQTTLRKPSDAYEISQRVQRSPTATDFMKSQENQRKIPVTADDIQILQTELQTAKAAQNKERLAELDQQLIDIKGFEGSSAAATPSGPPGATAERILQEYSSKLIGEVPQNLTVPVRPGTAQILEKQKYAPKDVIQFNEESSENLKHLELESKYAPYAGRWLAPNAPFRIRDENDTNTTELTEDQQIYPSITHFLAAMKFKYASTRPDYAEKFSRAGSIHQFWLNEREVARKNKRNKQLSRDDFNKFVKSESDEVERELYKLINQPDVGFDESSWSTVKDALLQQAIAQRLRGDKRFCVIVNAAIQQQKYLLYTNKKTELGGERAANGTIQGQNKYGRYILQLAEKLSDDFKACLELPDSE